MNRRKIEFSANNPGIKRNEIDTTETLENVVSYVKGNAFAEITKLYRNGKAGKDELFPYAMFSGLFSERKDEALIEHSGLIAIDIDKLEDVEEVFDQISKDPHTVFMYRTPSWNGLKVIIAIDIKKNTHQEYFSALENYFKIQFDIDIDKSCKNVSRAAYLCYDPICYVNYNADVFRIIKKKPLKVTPLFSQQTYLDVEQCIISIEELEIDLTSTYDRWFKIGAALANTFGEEGREFFQRVSAFHPEYDLKKCDQKFSECLKSDNRTVGIGTFFHYCKVADVRYKKKEKQLESFEQPVLGKVITANQRIKNAKSMPPLTALFGPFWLTSQICILFGDTGLGKSSLMVQIADNISKGKRSLVFLSDQVEKQKVLFVDFELSDAQFARRYTDRKNAYEFSDNFLFLNIDLTEYYTQSHDKSDISFVDWLFSSIKSAIQEEDVKVLIIDNITYLHTHSAQDTQVALDLMRLLKEVKDELQISIAVLAHPPKLKPNESLTLSHLGGSKHLSNFADSVFVLGNSNNGTNIRYLKHLKSRDAEMYFDASNVMTLALSMVGNMLKFEVEGFAEESDHISGTKAKEDQKEKVLELKKQGLSLRKIAQELGISHMKVKRIVDLDKYSR